MTDQVAGNGQAGPQGTSRRWKLYIPALGILGVVVSLIYATQVPGGSRWSTFGTALAVSGAAALAGGVVGFLFGIPFTKQGQAVANGQTEYQANTNLEQVSDWLTKILVGVGLVQIGHALPALGKLADDLKGPLGSLASSSAFGLGLMIFYALLGFLFLYLWSREVLPLELQGLAAVVKRQIDARDSTRSTALALVSEQLDAAKGGTPPTQDQLNQAIAAAPDSTRLLISAQAERIRAANHEQDKAVMAQTIPVFRALIAADTQNQDYRDHGSLGWALKDKDDPDWASAASELTTAIGIRDRLGIPGWKLYEANRAVCNIHLWRALPAGDPSAGQLAQQIEQDLAAARGDPYAQPMVDPASPTADPDITTWTPPPPPPPPPAAPPPAAPPPAAPPPAAPPPAPPPPAAPPPVPPQGQGGA